jgi:hypothetical protein
MTVRQLHLLLLADRRLRPTDTLIGNDLGNLKVERDGEYVGWIDLRGTFGGGFEPWDGDEPDDEPDNDEVGQG